MHQQVRTSTRKRPQSDGPGTLAADRGSLIEILEILDAERVNMRTAGGRDLDRGGQFVFAVHHGEHDDGTPDDGPDQEAKKLLDGKGYRAEVVGVEHCLVDDRPGSLLACIRNTEAVAGPIFEIFVGTSESDGRVPVQITTRGNTGESENTGDYQKD